MFASLSYTIWRRTLIPCLLRPLLSFFLPCAMMYATTDGRFRGGLDEDSSRFQFTTNHRLGRKVNQKKATKITSHGLACLLVLMSHPCMYLQMCYRDNSVWNATREICATYSVPYYKPIKPIVEGEEPELPPWLRVRGGGERVIVAGVDGPSGGPCHI